MTQLEESLRELAAEAPAPRDMAERALRTSRRRRNRVRIPTIATAVLAVVGVSALAAVGLPSTNGADPIRVGPDQAQTVRFPKTASPLPAEDVGPATFAYAYQDQWRVMLADGTDYEVREAIWPGGGDGYGAALLTVSPDGERIGYFHDDGTFVLRDLATGEVTPMFQWDRRVFSRGQQEAVWSPDGRWLLVIPGPDWGAATTGTNCKPLPDGGCRPGPTNDLADPVLLDVESARTVELPDTYNQLLGMSNGDALFPYRLEHDTDYRLPLFDHQGRERGEVPPGVLPGKNNDGVLGNISPDGRTLAALTFAPASSERAGSILVIALDAGRRADKYSLVHKYPLGADWMTWDSPAFAGWMTDEQVLIQSNELEPIRGADENGSTVRTVASNIHAVDVDTGKKTHLFHLPDKEGAVVGVAYRTLDQ